MPYSSSRADRATIAQGGASIDKINNTRVPNTRIHEVNYINGDGAILYGTICCSSLDCFDMHA